MNALIAFWGFALAATGFAALALRRLFESSRQAGQKVLLGAFAMTASWAWLNAIQPGSFLAGSAETARNLVWLAFLYTIGSTGDERQRSIRLVYGALALVIGMQFIAGALGELSPATQLLQTVAVLRLTTAAGALVLVHNIYGQAAPASRANLRFAMIGLAAMWIYDTNLYTLAYIGAHAAIPLGEWRGIFMALTAPLFLLASRTDKSLNLNLSRAATFQSISLLAICAYFILMAILATALRESRTDWPAAVIVGILAFMTVAMVAILPSPKARAWARVTLAKHLFEHRYDYRAEWLRFAGTLSERDPDAARLETRLVKAFADITDSAGGLLLTSESGEVAVAAEWHWPGAQLTADCIEDLDQLWNAIEDLGRIVEFDGLREGYSPAPDRRVPPPAWMTRDERFWIAVPLVNHTELVGLVLLAPPDLRRSLDWEDFDLLRTAGQQAASTLAEQRGRDALANAQRFDEFNRRFAFILHDIKNLVSQLSLVARNAERHADNPEFRADMVATLKSSVGKMNDLLARLAPHAQSRVAPPRSQPLRPILQQIVARHTPRYEVRMAGECDAWVVADAAALEQALGHLVQNGCEASPEGEPVSIAVEQQGDRVAIAIIDKGAGMDPDFVRNRLFQPFLSTKDGGFGIGAFEAKSLVQAMGGRLVVSSRDGRGTRFTITLPAGRTVDAPALSEVK